jgi:hypothetical protein
MQHSQHCHPVQLEQHCQLLQVLLLLLLLLS